MRGTVQILQARWDQVEVGDTVIDYTWAYPRWVTVTAFQIVDGTVHALFTDEKDASTLPLHHWYRTNPSKIVNVQVIT